MAVRKSLCFTVLLMMSTAFAQDSSPAQEDSLADIARTLRAKKKAEVVVNEEDAKQLFKDVESIVTFASEHSGLPKRTPVKYQLVGRDTVNRYFDEQLAQKEQAMKLKKSELVLKKFGLLPADFEVQGFAQHTGADGLAGFYDSRAKTMYLLNWIPLDKQRPVMAHELTHALQDQNYDLQAWKSGRAGGKDRPGRPDETLDARTAATEGQAMLIYLDYMLQPTGTSLAQAGDRIDAFKNQLMSVYDSPVEFKNAPLVFKEMSTFPYFDGFAFELEVLKRAGTEAAFAGVFAKPPRDTHDIMHPEDYLADVRPTSVQPGEIRSKIGDGYSVYDTGLVGELDVRTMSKQFGRENDAYSVAAFWDGGAYVAVKKSKSAKKTDSELAASDLAIMYVSRWKTNAAARRFAEIYRDALLKRTTVLEPGTERTSECTGVLCTQLWAARFETNDGPVVMELFPDNMLVIAQGFEYTLVDRVKVALRKASPKSQGTAEGSELMLRFAESPVVQAMRERLLREFGRELQVR
jgi:hypothetical protein